MEWQPIETSIDDIKSLKAACMDCSLPYAQFPLDVMLPRAQWLRIHPSEHGLLCASCIVKRVRRCIPRATVIHAVVEVAPPYGADAMDRWNAALEEA